MAADGHPFGDEEYGEYSESEQQSEDPEMDLEPEPDSGEDQPRVQDKGEEQGWQLPVSARGRRDEDLLLPRPDPQPEVPPYLPEELPELNLQLEQFFPEEPLPPEPHQGDDQRSGGLLALQDGKQEEKAKQRKEEKRKRRKEKKERKREE